MNNIPKPSLCLLVLVLLSACSPASGVVQTSDPAAALERREVPTAATAPQFRVLDSNTLAVGLVKVHKRERMLTLPAKVNMDHFAIEYALVRTAGKTHESLLATEASPRDIHMAALLLGVVPAAELGLTNHSIAVPAASSVTVAVSWDMDGKRYRYPLERLVGLATNTNERISVTLTNTQWLYTGSRVEGGRFAAEVDGSIISVIRDPLALMNSPDTSKDNDDIHFPNKPLLPAVGTPVTVELRLREDPAVKPANPAPPTPRSDTTK